MIARQFIDDDLACASYLVGSEGEAVVVDAAWDVAPYLAFAARHGLRIAHVVDTHVHADHVSGRGRLAAATGAVVHLPAGAEATDPHRRLVDGDTVRVGHAELRAIATPGHRPEHLSLVLTDHSRDPRPCALLSGDSLLVGDVARPDMVLRAREGARVLHDSLRRIAALTDDVELWPGHVGGSLCGGHGLSQRVSSTIGQERRANLPFGIEHRDAFVDAVAGELPPRPPTMDRVVAINRGPAAEPPPLACLAPAAARRELREGAVLVDGRPAVDFDALHVPGALCLPIARPGVGTRAGWALGAGEGVVAMAGTADEARLLARRLQAVGLEDIRGILADGVAGWRAAGGEVASRRAVDVAEASALLDGGEVRLVDVRDEREWRDDDPPALRMPLRTIPARRDDVLALDRPVVVACATGSRTALAASMISRHGHPDVRRLAAGGVAELRAAL